MQLESKNLTNDIYKLSKSLVDELGQSGMVEVNSEGVRVMLSILKRCFDMAVNVETANQNNKNFMANADLDNVTSMSDFKGSNVVSLFNDGGDAA